MNGLTRMEIITAVLGGAVGGALFISGFKLLAYVLRHW
jgi:hypothetical protein